MKAFVLAGQSNMSRNFNNLDAALKNAYGPDALSIRAAVGGSSITQWQRGQVIYQNALAKTLQAIDGGYDVEAILFFQGESETKPGMQAIAATWKNRFIVFCAAFGTDIGKPSIPVVFAKLGKPPTPATTFPFWETVRAQQDVALVAKPAYKIVHTDTVGPYERESDGTLGPHYHDDVVDTEWVGTGYKIITQRFINNTLLVVPA